MFVNNIFAKYGIEIDIKEDDSSSNRYDKILKATSLAFTKDMLTACEKKEIHMFICSLFDNLD